MSIVRFLIRRPWLSLLVALILTVAGGYYSARLYINLKPDIEELLPQRARSVQDYYELNRRLASTDYLSVLLFPKTPEAGRAFVQTLNQRLGAVPKDTLARVEYRIDETLKFFNQRKALYLDVRDLARIRRYIFDRIEYEKNLYNPLNIFSEVNLPEPRFDFKSLEMKYASKAQSYASLPGGYFATEDGKVFTLLAYLPSGGSKIDRSYKLKAAVAAVVNQIAAEPRFRDQVEIQYTGGVQDLIEEHSSLMADLELSTIVVTVLVMLVILIYFRSFRAMISLTTALLAGTLWSFGIAYFLVGYVNANSAFLGAIVFGNGINFGIILVARYIEELENRKGHGRALSTAIRATSKATLTAALAAGLSYGSLAFTEFRGFRQFGIIGLIGMLVCWIATFSLLPVLLHLFNLVLPVKNFAWRKRSSLFGQTLVSITVNRPLAVLATSILISLGALVVSISHRGEVLETNLSNLRDRHSEEHGSGYFSRYLHEIFKGYPHPTVVLAKNPQEADQVEEAMKKSMAEKGSDSLIAAVHSIQDLIPDKQDEKHQVLRQIKKLLSPRILAEMGKEDRARVDNFLTPEAMGFISATDLPAFVRNRMSEKDGTVGTLVLVEPPTSGVVDQSDRLISFVDQVRGAADSVRPGIPVAGQIAVSADMVRAIRRDGPKATVISFLAVVALVILLFRRLSSALPVLGSLCLGVLWLVGFIFASSLKVNFLNFIALPITFGIGVDYSVNIFQRYREGKTGNMAEAIRHSAGAVALASLTTIIGYGSLLLAGNRAFVSFGKLAVAGELACITSALLTLPAALSFFQNRKKADLL